MFHQCQHIVFYLLNSFQIVCELSHQFQSIRFAKKHYYEVLFIKFKDDIIAILNKSKKKKSFPNFFKDGDAFLTDQTEITNKFNIFFTNIGFNLSNQIKMPKNKRFRSYLTSNYNYNFKFLNINEDEITLIIDKLAPKTSCGFDGISTKLIKTIKTAILVGPVTLIINQMLNTGIFPDKLKIAKIIPIHKKGDETLFTNYMSILLLAAIFKMFENVIISVFPRKTIVLQCTVLFPDWTFNWICSLRTNWHDNNSNGS